MASSPPAMAVDPHRQGRFSLQLGNGLMQEPTTSRTFSSVRCMNLSEDLRENCSWPVDSQSQTQVLSRLTDSEAHFRHQEWLAQDGRHRRRQAEQIHLFRPPTRSEKQLRAHLWSNQADMYLGTSILLLRSQPRIHPRRGFGPKTPRTLSPYPSSNRAHRRSIKPFWRWRRTWSWQPFWLSTFPESRSQRASAISSLTLTVSPSPNTKHTSPQPIISIYVISKGCRPLPCSRARLTSSTEPFPYPTTLRCPRKVRYTQTDERKEAQDSGHNAGRKFPNTTAEPCKRNCRKAKTSDAEG